MANLLVLFGFGIIVFSPCLVALNATLGEEQSPLASFAATCRTKLQRIL